ncbi:MAG: 2-C-methyl-D-erythritol 4-phosphate cytidylyltransferase [Acutalibacteraceae bacterium]
MAKNIGIIFAGGTGTRMGNTGKPKQFLTVDGKPIIIHTLDYFQNHPMIDEIYIACKEDFIDYMYELLERFKITKVKKVVPGGETGQDSIYNGLMAAKENNDDDSIVLIHDGVRPVITSQLITDNINSAKKYGTGITSTPCFETIIISKDKKDVADIPYRKDTYAAQAPQTFRLGDILSLHDIERKENPTYENIVDSCTLYKKHGKMVHLVEGNRGNIKVTTPEDFFIFKALLNYRESKEVLGY